MSSPQHIIMSSLPIRMKNPMWNPQHEYYMEDCPFMEYYGMRHPGIFERHPSYPTEHASKMLVHPKPMTHIEQFSYPMSHHVPHHVGYPMFHHIRHHMMTPVQHPMTHHVEHPLLKDPRSYPKLQPIVHHNMPDMYRSIPL